MVRWILARQFQPEPGSDGLSWLTFLGHAKDSLWSLDLFCCESMMLRTHWVLVVMDHYTRRIIGFGIHVGTVNGEALCRMFKQAIRGVTTGPKYLSSDHDPLYRFHQWGANLRILGVTEIKTVPYVPWSHPFIERLIGTIRRECLDRLLFWTVTDLELKLWEFRDDYADVFFQPRTFAQQRPTSRERAERRKHDFLPPCYRMTRQIRRPRKAEYKFYCHE